MDWLVRTRQYWLILQKFVVVALIALAAVYAARLTWLAIEPVPEVTVPTLRPATAANASSGINYQQLGQTLAQRELFGEYNAAPSAAEDQPVEAPETQLRLVLQAILAQSGDGRGFAIIAQRNGQAKAFSVGDQVFDQAELSAVYNDRVLLQRNGQMETLRYERLATSELLRPNEDVAGGEISEQESFSEAVEQAQRQAAQGADVQAQVQQMVAYIGQRANSDPEGLLNEVGLEPTSNGYQVTNRARQLQMAGLRPGDIVTAVNDTPVGNISQDQALLNQVLQSGGELKIQIQRGSRSFTIYQSIPNF